MAHQYKENDEVWKPCIGKFAHLTAPHEGFTVGEKVLVIHVTPENDFCLVQNELDTHSDYVLYENLSQLPLHTR